MAAADYTHRLVNQKHCLFGIPRQWLAINQDLVASGIGLITHCRHLSIHGNTSLAYPVLRPTSRAESCSGDEFLQSLLRQARFASVHSAGKQQFDGGSTIWVIPGLHPAAVIDGDLLHD